MAPQDGPSTSDVRRNIYDDDKLDRLIVDTSCLTFGRRDPGKTADDVLQDRSTAPSKAAILSALATFDADDDERDDTYDIEDVGGTVDSVLLGHNLEETKVDTLAEDVVEFLYRAFKATPDVFARDGATRRGKTRAELRDRTCMTHEAIEGWALRLSRDETQMRRLDERFEGFSGAQMQLKPTAWRGSPTGSDTEDSDRNWGQRGKERFRGRGGRGNVREREGQVAGSSGEQGTEVARQSKEAHKATRANHNRRNQRAKKMARGGFAG